MNAFTTSRNSAVARLLYNEQNMFALERSAPAVFDKVLAAATCGFPRALLTAAQSTLNEACANGQVLSKRSSELLKAVNRSLKVPVLLRRTH